MTWLLFFLQENLQIYLKSTQGPIEVYLCPEEVQEPDSPTKEPFPSPSPLGPIPDSTQPSSSTDPGMTEPMASPGRTLCPEGQEVGRATSLRVSSSMSTFVGRRRGVQSFSPACVFARHTL